MDMHLCNLGVIFWHFHAQLSLDFKYSVQKHISWQFGHRWLRLRSPSCLNLRMEISIFCKQGKAFALKFLLRTFFEWIGSETIHCSVDISFTLSSYLSSWTNNETENSLCEQSLPYRHLGGERLFTWSLLLSFEWFCLVWRNPTMTNSQFLFVSNQRQTRTLRSWHRDYKLFLRKFWLIYCITNKPISQIGRINVQSVQDIL